MNGSYFFIIFSRPPNYEDVVAPTPSCSNVTGSGATILSTENKCSVTSSPSSANLRAVQIENRSNGEVKLQICDDGDDNSYSLPPSYATLFLPEGKNCDPEDKEEEEASGARQTPEPRGNPEPENDTVAAEAPKNRK